MLSEQLYFTHIEKIICVTRYLCLPCSPESKLHKVRDLDHCAHYWSICLTQCLALGSINICWIIGWAAEPFIMNYFSKICQIFIGFYYPAFIYPSSWINIIFSLEKYSTPYSKPRVICPQYLISLASDWFRTGWMTQDKLIRLKYDFIGIAEKETCFLPVEVAK